MVQRPVQDAARPAAIPDHPRDRRPHHSERGLAKGPHGRVVRSLSFPGDYVFLSRIDLGLLSVLAELRATAGWRGIQAELDNDAPPATPMGTAETAFWAAHPQAATR
jgi:hypothetical protein